MDEYSPLKLIIDLQIPVKLPFLARLSSCVLRETC